MKRVSERTKLAVLRAIEAIRDRDGNTSPELDTIAEEALTCKTTVKNALAVLQAEGLVAVTGRTGSTSIYRVTQPLSASPQAPSGPPEPLSTRPQSGPGEAPSGPPEPQSVPVSRVITTTSYGGSSKENTSSTSHHGAALSGDGAKDFSRFISQYPRHVNDKMRAEALTAWLDSEPPSLQIVLDALRHDCDGEWRGKEERFLPRPGNWLANRPWMKLRLAAPPVALPSWGVDNNFHMKNTGAAR